MASAADIILNIANGINWIDKELTKLRINITRRMAAALNDPVWGGLTLVGLIGGAVLLEVAINMVKQLKIVQAVTTFLKQAADFVKGLLAIAHVDLLITLFLLGKAFDPEWQKSLAAIYEALSNISLEIGKDASFINAFAEVNRSILFTASGLTGNAWLTSQANYADGLSVFLAGIQAKLTSYVDNPDQIFIDIQHAISEKRTDAVDRSLGNIWAAIGIAGDWITSHGDALIQGVNDFYKLADNFPVEVADAIHKQVDPLKANFDAFVTNTWDVFVERYTKANTIIIDYLNAHDIHLEEIQARIDDPISWLKAILGMDPDKRDSYIDVLYANITKRHNEQVRTAVETAAQAVIPDTDIPVPTGQADPVAVTYPVVHASNTLFGDVKTTLPNLWFKAESDSLVYPPGQQRDDGKSWFVGE